MLSFLSLSSPGLLNAARALLSLAYRMPSRPSRLREREKESHRDSARRNQSALRGTHRQVRQASRGPYPALATQLEIRSGGNDVDPALRDWIYERIGRQLGKYAEQIERVQVRFGDDNGPKGGEDKSCLVHVILSKLPPVVVEMRGETEREAFDLAAKSAERATRRNMEKHGYSTHHHKHKHDGHLPAALLEATDDADSEQTEPASEDSLIGRRQGHRAEQVEALVRGSESSEGDRTLDTSKPDTSADQTSPGADHTAARNAKLNTAGMSYRLEDSTTGKPSRKSTRGGTNRVKPGNPLTQRTKAAVQGPKQTAMRAAARGR